MADQETLDSSPPQSDDVSYSQSSASASSSSDPSLSRNLSSSRLNAGAPEFVPGRATPSPPPPPPIQQQQQQPRMMIPPPPPPALLHMYPHPPPFHVPIQGPVPMPPPPHMVPVQNHHPSHHHHHHHHPHHQNRHGNHQFVPVRNHNHHDHQHRGGGGEQDPEAVVKKGDHDRWKDQKKDHKKDHTDSGAATVSIDSKSGLSDDVVQKIVNQVEYYFSDLNLATTDHLMRFINKDPEGYVPIPVVASFKKIKALVSSNSQLATVLRSSSKLVVNEDGKKVRRQHPITESAIEELQSRIVIAENLPEDHCYQNLMKIFSAAGSVKNIRTCQPQNPGGGAPSAARPGKSDAALFSNKLHAFVEYETVELAEKAVAELNEEGNWRSGLKVRLMLKHQTKDSKHAHGRGRKVHQDGEAQHEEDDTTTSEQQPNEKQLEDCSGEWDAHVQEHTVGEEHGNEKTGGQRKGRNRGRGKGRGRGQHQHNNNRGNHHHHQVGTPPLNNGMGTDQATVVKQQPPGPRMPDGTRGFSMGRGKPVTQNAE